MRETVKMVSVRMTPAQLEKVQRLIGSGVVVPKMGRRGKGLHSAAIRYMIDAFPEPMTETDTDAT